MTVLLTGLPSSGKSTIALGVGARLDRDGRSSQILDGDLVRQDLCSDLGFSAEDRQENLRRVGFVAAMLASHGVVVLVLAIAPYRASRAAVRARHDARGIPFYEMHVSAPLEVCSQRDVKGLYRRRQIGEISGLIGVDDPYEPPEQPELRLHTHREEATDSVQRVLQLIGVVAFDAGTDRQRLS